MIFRKVFLLWFALICLWNFNQNLLCGAVYKFIPLNSGVVWTGPVRKQRLTAKRFPSRNLYCSFLWPCFIIDVFLRALCTALMGINKKILFIVQFLLFTFRVSISWSVFFQILSGLWGLPETIRPVSWNLSQLLVICCIRDIIISDVQHIFTVNTCSSVTKIFH